MSEPSEQERRASVRHRLRAHAQLAGKSSLEAHILDISRDGARIALLEEHSFAAGDALTLTIEPSLLSAEVESLLPLTLNTTVVHKRQHILGLICEPQSPQDSEKYSALISAIDRP